MRYAIISDVHANEAALRAVLTDAADAHADKVICLGDVLGYGPDPVAALELVYRRAHVCLAGNHDDAVANRFPVEDFTDFAADVVLRHRAALTREAVDWLRHLPYTCEFEGFACAHGDFSDPKHFNYILEPQDAMPSWAERPEQLLFVGHSHKPGIFVLGASGTPHLLDGADFTLEDGKRYIVNPGSVGYPRSGACRSSYCIYDDQSRTVFFRTLPFDLDSYAAKMHGQGLNEAPWMLARAAERRRPAVRGDARFGIVRNTPSAPDGRDKRDLPSGGRAAQPGRAALVAAEAAGRRFPKWAGMAIAACVVASAAIVAYTIWIVRSLPKEPVADVPVQEVPYPLPPVQPASETAFSELRELAEGWSVAFESAAEQKVVIDYNTNRNVRVFRIAHAAPHTVRFTKRLDLRPRSGRVYWRVARADPRRRRADGNFQFTTHLVFSDEKGAFVSKEDGGGKMSETKDCRVPETAVDAVLSIDCFCTGTHEIAVPFFDTRENPRRQRK